LSLGILLLALVSVGAFDGGSQGIERLDGEHGVDPGESSTVTTAPFGEFFDMDVLVIGTGIERRADGFQPGGRTPYATHDILGVEVVSRVAARTLDSGESTSDFPPITSPQRVSGYALTGFAEPAADYNGPLLAALYVTDPELELVGVPPWHVSWIAKPLDGGDVEVWHAGISEWDAELAEFADLLGRSDQTALLIDWVMEAQAVRDGAEPGPIILAYESNLPPEPLPPPSIEIPVLVLASGVPRPEVGGDPLDTLVFEPASLDDSYLPTEIFLDDPPWPMTALMYAGDPMVVEIWDDGRPVVHLVIAASEWEPIVAIGGGVIARVTLDSSGIYSLAVEVLNQADFDEVVSGL
jgi:hypothetical protein